MTEYTKQTDEVQVITLESKIDQAFWCSKIAVVEEKIDFQVWTHFVGNGSEIEIKVKDKQGSTIEKTKGQVYGNYFGGSIIIPKKAKEEITFTAKLPKHGIEMESNKAKVIPPIEITNMKWGQKEARRGDIVKITADVEGATDETEVMIYIYEYDLDEAHDFITKFPCNVKDKKIEAEWEYEYHEDTDDIPTDEEMKEVERSYNPPEYFWVCEVGLNRFGENQESELLEFKDWIEIELLDQYGDPVAGAQYSVLLADGSEVEGKLDNDGFARIEDVVPGPYQVQFPDDEADL